MLTVAVVPAVDSAGFFVALDQGLFKAQGLTVNFTPVTSSEDAIASVGKVRLQRVVDVRRQFLNSPAFTISSMLMGNGRGRATG